MNNIEDISKDTKERDDDVIPRLASGTRSHLIQGVESRITEIKQCCVANAEQLEALGKEMKQLKIKNMEWEGSFHTFCATFIDLHREYEKIRLRLEQLKPDLEKVDDLMDKLEVMRPHLDKVNALMNSMASQVNNMKFVTFEPKNDRFPPF